MQLSRCDQLATLFQRRVDTARVTQARQIGQPIQHLGHTHLAAIGLFDAEIARRQRPVDAVFNRRRFHNLIDVGHVDDVFVIVGGPPRTVVNLPDHLFLHFFHQFVEIIPEQIVEQRPRQFDALVHIRITVVGRKPSQTGLDQLQTHVPQHVQLLRQRLAMGKQVVVQDVLRKLLLLLGPLFLVHVDGGIRRRRRNVPQGILIEHVFVRVNDGRLQEFQNLPLFTGIVRNMQQNVLANGLVTHDPQRTKDDKEFNRHLDPRNVHIDSVPKSIVFRRNHHFNLLGRDAFEIRNRFHLGKPAPLGRVLTVEAVDTVFRRPLLPQDRLLAALDDEIAAAVHGTLSHIRRIDGPILGKDTNRGL